MLLFLTSKGGVTGMNSDAASPHKEALVHYLNYIVEEQATLKPKTTTECTNIYYSTAITLLDALLNNPHEKVIITDRKGIILFINDAYAKIINMKREEVIGRDVKTILGNDTRMHIVGKTLQPELHGLFHTANTDAVARRLPLVSEGNVLGVMGKDLFINFDDLFSVAQQAKDLKRVYSFQINKNIIGNTAKYDLDSIITSDPEMLKIKTLVKNAAMTTSTILLQGETGVGKELFAHSIHQKSRRSTGPFISVNCGAIPETLLESELFGYEDGAFTGARKGGKPGKFELAHGGTIFLDEIGEIAPVSQVKILRVLQEKEIERIGASRPKTVDVRVIASTNRNLWSLCQSGKFREDLYFRLSVVPVIIPPLRDRIGDIPELVEHFIDKYNKAFGLQVKSISNKALKQLKRYHWPGNVRELESVVESAMNNINRDDRILTIFTKLQPSKQTLTSKVTLKEALEKHEAAILVSVLTQNDWHMEETAKDLNISPASLYRKLKKYGIT